MGLIRAFLALSLLLCACSDPKSPVPVYDLKLSGRSAGTATVLQGDSLSAIAKRYALTIDDIIRANMISGDVIQPGQRLYLPPPRNYTVRAGDTVVSVAGMFDVKAQALVDQNNLRPPYALHVGQVLSLPGGSQASMPSVTATPLPSGKPYVVAPRQAGLFATPVQGRVISTYGEKSGGLFNDGINIAAAPGAPVHAADAGTVVYAGNGLEGYGNLVLIRHEGGFFTIYSHMAETRVAKGVAVGRGQRIGSVGASGKVSEPQLHFEIRKGTESLNPQDYL